MWIRLSLLFLSLGLLSCGQNAFVESAKKDTDEARIFEARKLMNQSRWDEAITAITATSAAMQAKRETKSALASAYAGKCGLNLIRMADQLSSAGSSALFPILLTALQTADATAISSCQQAETILLSINATAASRTADENTLLAFVGFAKIGAILALYADTNDDGTAEGAFNPCNTGELPDAMLREVGTGITISVASLGASGTSIGSTLSTSVTSACATLAGVNPAYDFCSVMDPTAFSTDQVKAIGGIVRSTDTPGLGTCAGDIATCVCP